MLKILKMKPETIHKILHSWNHIILRKSLKDFDNQSIINIKFYDCNLKKHITLSKWELERYIDYRKSLRWKKSTNQ